MEWKPLFSELSDAGMAESEIMPGAPVHHHSRRARNCKTAPWYRWHRRSIGCNTWNPLEPSSYRRDDRISWFQPWFLLEHLSSSNIGRL
jgi:hypothetical protein